MQLAPMSGTDFFCINVRIDCWMMNYVVTQTAFTRLLTWIFKQNSTSQWNNIMNLFACRGNKAGKLAIAENRGILKNRSRGNECQCRGKRIIYRRRKPTSWQFGCCVQFRAGAYGRSQKFEVLDPHFLGIGIVHDLIGTRSSPHVLLCRIWPV